MKDHALAQAGDEFIDLIAQTYPSSATLLGIHDYDGELGSFSESSMAAFASSLRALRARAAAIDSAELGAAARIDHRFLLNQIDAFLLEVEGPQWWRRNPDFVLDLALSALFFPVIRDFAPAGERARSVESRLRLLGDHLAESRATLSDTPTFLIETAAQSADEGAEFIATGLVEWAEGAGDAGRGVRDAAPEAAAAMRAHAEWLRSDYTGTGSQNVGVGPELLARVIRTNHMLPDSPDEIAARGERMIARLTEEIDDVATMLGFADWRTAVSDVKKDVPPENELVDTYREAMRWTEQVVRDHDLATIVEDAQLDVVETPRFWRHTMPYAAYSQPGAFERSQRGIFWVTPPDGDAEKLKGHPRPSITVVALHEGFPGHHLQLTRANKHPSRLRRMADSSLLAEGWAFYCEEMAHEEGLLSPEARLCQLKDELWRACRVVIDMRLHQGAMSPAEAVDMLVGEADLERPNAEAEVRRYSYTPGYQMSYAIGKEEILELREQVKASEGANFSLKKFHDRVLDEGTLPTPLIAEALTGRK